MLGQQFSNVIQVSELSDLMVEVSALKGQGCTFGEPENMEVDDFFSNLRKVTDHEGNSVFYIITFILCKTKNKTWPLKVALHYHRKLLMITIYELLLLI